MGKTNDLSKCKHPNSRKTLAVIKRINKNNSRQKSKQKGYMKLNLLGEKIAWFSNNIKQDNQTKVCSPEYCITLIEKYLSRFNEELEQINLIHSIGKRKNRKHASRQDIINLTIQRELEEFEGCGLEVPDILNAQQFNLLINWTGELRYLSNFNFKRYSRTFLKQECQKFNNNNKVNI